MLIGASSLLDAPVALVLPLALLPWRQARCRCAALVSLAVGGLCAAACALVARLPLEGGGQWPGRLAALVALPTWVMRLMAQKVTPAAEMTALQIAANNSNMAGTALGPMFGAAVCFVIRPAGPAGTFADPYLAVCALWAALLLAGVALLPSTLCGLQWQEEEPGSYGTGAELLDAAPAVTSDHRTIWWSAVWYDLERGVVVGALEAASSLIFEQEYGWTPETAGLVVGAAFLSGLLFAWLVARVQSCLELSDVDLVRLLAGLMVAAACLLFPRVGKSMTGEAAWGDIAAIILSDCLICPSAFISKGIIDSLAVQCAVSQTFYSQENLLTVQMIVASMVGRFSGAPLARFLLSTAGRDGYALIQLCMSIFGCYSVLQATLAASALGKK